MIVKDVCTFETYLDKASGQEKKSWSKIGTAFVRDDGSISIKLIALPLNGMMSVFERKQKQQSDPFAQAPAYQGQNQMQMPPAAGGEDDLPF